MCYNGNSKKKRKRELEQIFKNFRSLDYFLQLENMKVELPVIVNQHVTVKK